MGGENNGYLASTEFYDPVGNSWSGKAPMLTARYYLGASPVTIGGVAGALAVGGGNPGYLSAAEFYDPGANTWAAKATMLTARWGLAVAPVTIGGVAGVLAIGGIGASGYTAVCEFYDPSANAWSAVAPVSSARVGMSACSVTMGGVAGVLAMGGFTGTWQATAEFYDPGANTWTSVAPMTNARQILAAAPVTIGGVTGVLAVGGNNTGGILPNVEFYDPAANTWTNKAALPIASDALAASPVTIAGTAGVLETGGYNGGPLGSARFYDPTANTWSAMASMLTSRWGLASVPLSLVPPSPTESGTPTATRTASPTRTISPTASESGTTTTSATQSPSGTATACATPTTTATGSGSRTATHTASGTGSETAMATITWTETKSLTPTPTTTITAPRLYVDRNVFSPSNGEKVGIHVELVGEAVSQVVLFNSAGEWVITLFAGTLPARTAQVLWWDGRNDKGSPCASGVFVVRLSIGVKALVRRVGLTR